MKRLLFLIAFSLFTLSNDVFAQEVDYLRKANEAFAKGEYSNAITMCKLYYVETGKHVPELRKMAEDCKGFLESGDAAVARNDIETARANYIALLKLNPDDNDVKSKLDKLVPTDLKIGDEFMGGTVAYIDNTGRHGFVIHSVSRNRYLSQETAKESCQKGLRLPSSAELEDMAKNKNKLPLPLDELFFVNDDKRTHPILRNKKPIFEYTEYERKKLLKLVERKDEGFAIYLKDF